MSAPVAVAVPGIEDLVEIGRGGAGVVYRGRQRDLDRDVAVKVVSPAGAADADLARWRREVTAMARLANHPNILAVHDGGTTADGVPYLVMPYVPGGSLGDRLRTSGSLPADEVRALGRKLAGALAAAHEAGVLHRDVKPDNVLLSPYGEPQLADFGIARLSDATTTLATNGVHATVAYAAPEVLAGQPATEASDVYGLGATLHACLTGQPPFRANAGESLVALAVRISSQPAPDLRAAGVPPDLAAVVEDAMAKDPGRRIASARELERRLGDHGPPRTEVVAGPTAAVPVTEPRWRDDVAPRPEPVPAPPMRPPSPTRTPAPRPRRGGGGALLAALAVAILGALAALLLLRGGDDPPDDRATTATTAAPTTDSTEDGASDTAPPATTAATTVPAGDLGQAALAYFDAIAAGDYADAYAMTTPGFQAAQPYDGYVEFWSGVGDVAVEGEPRVDESAMTATVDLRLGGGGETYTLQFVPGDGGELLVDGPRPR